MADCDMCGKKGTTTVRAMVEGVEMNVCPACSKYGEKLTDHSDTYSTNVKREVRRRQYKSYPDEDKRIAPDYSGRIKQAREKLGLKQEDLAKKLNEKESLLHKFESGHMRPSFKVARKIERFLRITLIENVASGNEAENIIHDSSSSSGEGLTMGDLLKKALNKKK
ncbi:MAG: multiprotein bridging factor aMBF1 [Nanobdellota archaeon]